jgi:O-antigen/teichoic acid export membrane protein
VTQVSSERSLTVSALWLLGAKTIGFGFMFLLPLLLVRQLSQHDFGVYKQLFLVVGTAVSLLPLGFGMSAYYFLPRLAERRGRIVLNILFVYTAIAVSTAALLVARPDLLRVIFSDDSLTPYAGGIALIVLLWLPSSVLETLAVANGQARLAGRFIVALQCSRALLLLGAAVAVGTIEALIAAAVLHGLVQTGTFAWYLSARFRGFWRELDWSMLRSQLAYGAPLGASALLYWFQVDLHKYVVAHEFDAATYAIYAVGCFEMPLLGILNESVGSVLIPRMSELQRDGRRAELVRVAAGALRKLAAVHVPFWAFVLAAGPSLVVLLFTDQYLAAWPIFLINMSLIPFSIPTIPCDAVIRAHAEHRYFLVKLRLISTTLLLLGLWLSLDRFGLVGAISVVVLVNFFERVTTTVKATRILRMTRQELRLFGDPLRIVAASLGAALVAYGARTAIAPEGALATVLLTFVVLTVAYVVMLLVLRVPSDDERQAAGRLLSMALRRPPGAPVIAGAESAAIPGAGGRQ